MPNPLERFRNGRKAKAVGTRLHRLAEKPGAKKFSKPIYQKRPDPGDPRREFADPRP